MKGLVRGWVIFAAMSGCMVISMWSALMCSNSLAAIAFLIAAGTLTALNLALDPVARVSIYGSDTTGPHSPDGRP